MIKSLIILVLLIVVAGGAFLSRPKPADFRPFIQQKIAAGQGQGAAGNVIKDVLVDMQVKNYLDHCTFEDRLLWMTVIKDEKPAFVGAFSHCSPSATAAGRRPRPRPRRRRTNPHPHRPRRRSTRS